mgnify:CR=1 FL=1
MVTQHFETMVVRGKADEIGDELSNQDVSIEDMTGYIYRMGGELQKTLVEGKWVIYTFVVPSHWVGRMYERFLSFGFRAKLQYESLWYGLLEDD